MKCEQDGCRERAERYVLNDGESTPEFFFCDEHAAKFGFCTFCGAFIGGTEDVFLAGRDGLCFDCFMELERELSPSEDDDGEPE